MPKIVKIHGCSGAGKTTATRLFMSSAKTMAEVTPEGARKPEAYILELEGFDDPVAVLGSYKNNCGGMDSYSSNSNDIVDLIEAYRKEGCHILFEGLLLSTYYGAVGKHLEQYGNDFVCAFMDTPLLVCLARISQRRAEQGSKNKFDPQNTVDKFNTIERLKDKCAANGRNVATIRYDSDPVAQLRTIYLNHV